MKRNTPAALDHLKLNTDTERSAMNAVKLNTPAALNPPKPEHSY